MERTTNAPEATEFSEELTGYLGSLVGAQRTAALATSLRRPGPFLYLRTNTLRTTNKALVEALGSEGVTAQVVNAALNAVAIPIPPAATVPRHPKLVVADKASSENVVLGSHLYRPGVLRTDTFHEGDSVTIVNIRGHIVGSGVGAGDSVELQRRKEGLFVRVTHPLYRLPSLVDLDAHRKGLFYSQSLSAMLVAPVLDPQPGETIIDLGAAPGGKTTHIAQLTVNQCRVIAVDRSRRRMARLAAEVTRLGIRGVEPFTGKAQQFCEQNPDLQADRVLVDPPCTALGVRPKLFDTTTLARIHSTAAYQRMILDSAMTTVRPKGILVYSTCTLTVEENEHNIQYLLTKGFKLERQTPYLGAGGLAGDKSFRQRVQRISPDLHNLPGQFIAKLRKTAA
jgi:16S rRNA C967 or C1407 C5-methylase (RsmB/RsmF family)